MEQILRAFSSMSNEKTRNVSVYVWPIKRTRNSSSASIIKVGSQMSLYLIH